MLLINIMKTLNIRLLDFIVESDFNSDFTVDMYGIDLKRNTYSIKVNKFKPFIYILVGTNWTEHKMNEFIDYLKNDENIGYTCKKGISSYSLVEKKKLYGFNGGKYDKFILIEFNNMTPIYKIKSLYYDNESQKLKQGLMFNGTRTYLYESFIPPLLRLFHIQEISPSGWITIEDYVEITNVKNKKTYCTHELLCDYVNIKPNKNEKIVPFKICSFDIEANSSHGDFPEPHKDYKKVSYDIINYLINNSVDDDEIEYTVRELLKTAFGFSDKLDIDRCYVVDKYDYKKFEEDMNKLFNSKYISNKKVDMILKKYFKEENSNIKMNKVNKSGLIDMLLDPDIDTANMISNLLLKMDSIFPKLCGDQVTFIGSTFVNYGEEKPYLNHCVCLGKTEQLEKEHTIESYKTEKELLLAWKKLIREEDPDIIIGYNIFGFDYKFMYERSIELDCLEEFLDMNRTKKFGTELIEKSIILASGPHDYKFIEMAGRLQIDLYGMMKKDYQLSSYKLDYVSGYLISDKVKSYENEDDECCIYTNNMKGLEINSYVTFEINNNSSELYEEGKKYKITEINENNFYIEGNIDIDENESFNWKLAKDDVSPKDIFELSKKGPKEKGIIAKYCIQDCNLVQQIFQKIDILTSLIEMSSLCSVPMSFLVMRGQGIKSTSFMAKKCREKDILMPLISKGPSHEAYEGAIVLEPKCDLYIDIPVACVDYSSLYPSSEISENISHDSKVWTKDFNMDGTPKIGKNGKQISSGVKSEDDEFIYDNLEGYGYVDIDNNTYEYKRQGKSAPKKCLTGYRTCRFAQFPDNQKGVLASILQELLKARKDTKKLMKNEKEPFMKNILDKRQNSIKLTANSLYGQCGSKTSTFYDIDVAASTTSVGKTLLKYAKAIIEEVYGDSILDTSEGKVISNATYVYGDTDSVFFTFNFKEMDGTPIKGKKALKLTIEKAKEAGELASMYLKDPHDLEYEKTFMPFCLLAKKRYVGMLYEEDINKCYRKSMGIVLKRRDNAPIVKDVYGGIIDILMNDGDIDKSIKFLREMLDELVNKKINIDKLIISKSLRSVYANPNSIAHAVLANRIGMRDPGKKPAPGDRVPYVYIVNKKPKALQGERIEDPTYVIENNVPIDYTYYITGQIMIPVIQLFGHVLYSMPQFKRKLPSFKRDLETMEQNMTEEVFANKKQKMIDDEVKKILFDDYIRISNNVKNGNKEITSMFKIRK